MRRVKGWTSSTIVLGLVLAGLAVAPSASAVPDDVPVVSAGVAGGAAKKKAPRFTVSKKRTTKVTKPFTLTTTSRLPVLKGSTARNRNLVTKRSKSLIAAEKKSLVAWHGGCEQVDDAILEIQDIDAHVYRARYASVAIVFYSNPGCGGVSNQSVRSFTLDLRTGRTVGMSTFAAPSARPTKVAIMAALAAQSEGCVDTSLKRLPAPDSWNVSAKGMRVWFDKYAIAIGACGIQTAVVPWSALATSKQLTGTRFSRTYVRNLEPRGDGYYRGEYYVLTVQGRYVALRYEHLSDTSSCSVGVRTGKKARVAEIHNWTTRTVKLGGSVSKPRIALGEGWHEASAKERGMLAVMGVKRDAIAVCGASGGDPIGG